MRRHDALGLALLAFVACALVVSGIGPRDRTTWWLEVLPVLLVVPLVALTYRRFPLTPLVLVLMALHALVLVTGGHWTYAEVPLGEWAQETFGFARNHYDRIGHFTQGFVPAMAAREILLRASPLRPGAWTFTLTTAVTLAASALYELLEWLVAVVSEDGSVAFLGTQGDPWDTQWDMFLCLVGALLSQALLGRLHDRQLSRLPGATGASLP